MSKFLCSYLLLLNVGILKCQTWQWAFSTKELTNIQTVIDSSENVYVAGYFQGDSCLFNGTNVNGQQNYNLLLAKLSPVGTTLWTKVCSSTSIKNVGIFEYNGEVILGVNFSGNMTGFINDSSTSQKYFIAKVNASGNLTYYKKEGNANLISMDITLNGSILANGTYTNNTIISSETLTNNSSNYSGFFLRYNNNGSLSLIKNLAWSSGTISKIRSDAFSNIFMSADLADSLKIINDTVFNFASNIYQYATELLRFNSVGKLQQVSIMKSGYLTSVVDYRIHGNDSHTIRLFDKYCHHCKNGLIIKRTDTQNNDTWQHWYGLGSYYNGPGPGMDAGALTTTENKIYFVGSYFGKQLMGADTIYNNGMILAKMNHAGGYEKVITAQYALYPKNSFQY